MKLENNNPDVTLGKEKLNEVEKEITIHELLQELKEPQIVTADEARSLTTSRIPPKDWFNIMINDISEAIKFQAAQGRRSHSWNGRCPMFSPHHFDLNRRQQDEIADALFKQGYNVEFDGTDHWYSIKISW